MSGSVNNALEQYELWAGYEAWLDERENENMITEHEYKFLTNEWDGPKGAAFNAIFEFCRCFGLCAGFDAQGRPILSRKGARVVKDYRMEQGTERIDVV